MVAALYRRYRPETFAEMIGQQQVTEPLMTALRTGRINHAYLFSGPRGCGKTSSARILARCLNCAEGPTPTPCGECASCRELGRDGGGSLDVVEIDAASHGGVDDARDLRERAMTAPARDRYKIFIIDEAHMVTSAGFNALLKVVEEPPEEVLFLFATTEPEKVIGTIRSRTHHYPFRLIPPATMLTYIGEICESEGVTAEPGVLPLVVRAGGGSARDTLSLLDQLIAGTDGVQIPYEMASQLLGFTSQGLLDATISAIASGNAAEAIKSVDAVIQSGQDPRRFVEDLLERVRDLIVAKATGASVNVVLRGRSDDDLAALQDSSARFTPSQLSRIADLVNETLTEMSGVTAPRVQLELMVARVLVAMRASFASADAVPPAPSTAEASAPPAPEATAAPVATRPPAATPAPAARPAAGSAVPSASDASGQADARSAAPDRDASRGSERRPDGPRRDERRPEGSLGDAKTQATSAWAATAEPGPAPTAPERAEVDPASIDFRRVTDVWPDVLAAVQREGGRPAWSVAQQIVPVSWDAGKLRVEFPNRGVFEQFRTGAGGRPSPGETLKTALHEVLGTTPMIYPRVRRSEAPGRPERPAPSADDADRHRRAGSPDAGARDAGPRGADRRGQGAAAAAPAPSASGEESAIGWNVAPIPTGPAEDGPGSGWDELAEPAPAEPERAPEIIAAREAEAHERATAPEPLPPATVRVDDPMITTRINNPVVDAPASDAPEQTAGDEPPSPAPRPAQERSAQDGTSDRPTTEPAGPDGSTPTASGPSWTVAQVGPAVDAEPEPEPEPAEPEPVDPFALPEGVERYGEAVIRERLGARFVGEEPIVDTTTAVAADEFGSPPDDFDAPPEEY